MSYPPPPGFPPNSASNTHPSLPRRPPPSTTNLNSNSNFKPAFPQNAGPGRGGAFAGFAPRSLAPLQQPHPQPYNNYQQPQPYPQQQYNAYSAPPPQNGPTYGAAPQIRNPFAPPSVTTGRGIDLAEDPEMAAQIAQWQSAYAGPQVASNVGYTGPVRKYPVSTGEGSVAATSANAAPLGGLARTDSPMTSVAMTNAAHNDSGVATVVSDAKTNTKTVVRSGGGTTWQDSSLLEWDPAHHRLFVGNLAGEVTDESLQKAFAKWPSVQKARVIRDKRTTKSKGYGFVSFSDGDEFFQAGRDMNGKYIGSHPVLVKRSTTDIKAVNPKDNRNKGKNRGGKGKPNNDKTGAGVQKPGIKTKGGLKVLG